MAAKGKRFCWTEAGQPVEESISTAMARQGSVKTVWILSLGLICSSFFCFQEFPFKYFLSMMLDNLFEIQVIEQKFMLNVKVALCDVVLKMSFSRSTVAFPILLGLASARPYSFFFSSFASMPTHLFISSQSLPHLRQELWFLQSPSGGAGWCCHHLLNFVFIRIWKKHLGGSILLPFLQCLLSSPRRWVHFRCFWVYGHGHPRRSGY